MGVPPMAHGAPFSLGDARPAAVTMGALAALVGFASSFAVVLAGLRGVGADPAQAASGLAAAAIAMGIGGIVLSLWTRLPVSVAWTTPGAALLATSAAPAGGFAEAVGAFVVCGVLLASTAFLRPLARAVSAIPLPIASAMLAGIVLPLALAPVRAVTEDWRLGLPIALSWLLAGRAHRLLAVPAALAALVGVTLLGTDLPPDTGARLADAVGLALRPVPPAFSPEVMIGLGVPLYVVTMASQNIPGLAVLRAHGYEPPAARGFAVTGALSRAAAPFGGPAVNLAAITAAMCAGEEAGRDSRRRYWSAVVAGLCYVAMGLLAGVAALFVTLAPAVLIEAVAGLALIATLSAALRGALHAPETREAAAVTFLVAGGGLSVAGVSGAFWALLAGLAVHALARGRR